MSILSLAALTESAKLLVPDMVVRVELPTQGGIPQWLAIVLQGGVGALVGSLITLFGVRLTNINNQHLYSENRKHELAKLQWQWEQNSRKDAIIPLLITADKLRIATSVTSEVKSPEEHFKLILALANDLSQQVALASLFLSTECMGALNSVRTSLKATAIRNSDPMEHTAAMAQLRADLTHFAKAARKDLGVS